MQEQRRISAKRSTCEPGRRRKVFFKDGSWIICRFSGTEPLLRMAAEGETRAQALDYIHIWRKALDL